MGCGHIGAGDGIGTRTGGGTGGDGTGIGGGDGTGDGTGTGTGTGTGPAPGPGPATAPAVAPATATASAPGLALATAAVPATGVGYAQSGEVVEDQAASVAGESPAGSLPCLGYRLVSISGATRGEVGWHGIHRRWRDPRSGRTGPIVVSGRGGRIWLPYAARITAGAAIHRAPDRRRLLAPVVTALLIQAR